jgi:Flp pilus assembly protein TadB
MRKRSAPTYGLNEGFYTRTLIRAHAVCGLIAAAVVGEVVDWLGYNATPWAFGTAFATVVILVIVLMVRRRRSAKEMEPGA